MPFRALGLDPRILKAVQEAGYTEPTPIQAAAIPLILAGHDLIGIAQTGTGKTAAFTLPILAKLAAQPAGLPPRHPRAGGGAHARIGRADRGKHPRLRQASAADASPRFLAAWANIRRFAALRSGMDVIIACPGRLLDLMSRRNGDFSGLQFLVLDEADRMLDMGFLPAIRQIVRRLPQKRQTLLFSATLSREIEALTHEFQRAPRLVQIGRRSNPAETVTQLVYEVPKHLKPALLVHLLRDPQLDMVLVFSRMKHGADRIARNLEQKGSDCHAAFESLAKPAAARVEGFQIRRGARAGGDGHRGARH